MTDGIDINDDIVEEAENSIDGVLAEAVERYNRQLHELLAHALVAGYDGVDINRPNPVTGLGIKKIVPWERPPPNGANGYRTERYTWDWFSDDELTTILRADRVTDVFDE